MLDWDQSYIVLTWHRRDGDAMLLCKSCGDGYWLDNCPDSAYHFNTLHRARRAARRAPADLHLWFKNHQYGPLQVWSVQGDNPLILLQRHTY